MVYGERGWAIERATYADEFLERPDRFIADSDVNAFADPSWLTGRNSEGLQLVPDRIEDMDVPGYKLHPLKGRAKGRWSISVSGNWRLTFDFRDGNVRVLDYEDYH